jgi:multicomponent Na+:H+ antiporter subunit D
MCLPQRHLARLLAFATVSHVGVKLLGVALLDGPGLGGALLYMVTDGLVKAALFVGVGVLAHRFGTVDAGRLSGAGRHMPRTAGLMLAGAAGLAGLPPFGTWLGKALIDEAAADAGHGWIAWVVFASAVLTAGAIARAVAWVFTKPRAAAAGAGEAADGAGERPPRPPLVMWLPGAAFVAVALLVGLLPGIAGQAGAAAAEFTDTRGYAATVLHGREPVAAPPGHGLAHPGGAAAIGAAATVRAALIGLTGVRRPPPAAAPARPGALRRVATAPVVALRAIHSGEVGDSVAWFTVGAATLTATLGILLR